MKKRIIYTNSAGMSMEFGWKKPYLLEKIDCCSGDTIIIAESLAGESGQITIDRKMPGKSITLELSAVIPYDAYTAERRLQDIQALFDPLLDGTLQVYTPFTVYTIDCAPTAEVYPEKTGVWYKYNFAVHLKSDDSCFKKGTPVPVTLSQYSTTVRSSSAPALPVRVTFPEGFLGRFDINGAGITIGSALTAACTLDTKEMILRDSQGNPINNKINFAAPIEKIRLRCGKNTVHCDMTAGDVLMEYDELVGGVP